MTESDIRCQTVWIQALHGVDAMCQDSREAESEKVCVNVHEHVAVQELYRHIYMGFVCVYTSCMWNSIYVRRL